MLHLNDIPRKLIVTGLTAEVVNLRHMARIEGKKEQKLDLSAVQDRQLAQTWAALRGAVKGKVIAVKLDLSDDQSIEPSMVEALNAKVQEMLLSDEAVELLVEEHHYRTSRAVGVDPHIAVSRPHAEAKIAPAQVTSEGTFPTEVKPATISTAAEGGATTPTVPPTLPPSTPPGGAKVDPVVDGHPEVKPQEPAAGPGPNDQVTSDGVNLGEKIEPTARATPPAAPPATGEAAPAAGAGDSFAGL